MDERERRQEVRRPANAESMPQGVRQTVMCPFCASREVELVSLFGGQLSTDQYYCRACRTYFERFGRDDEEPTP